MSRVTLTNPFDLLTDENEDRTNVPAVKKEQKPAPAKPAAKPAATGVAAKPAAAKQAAPKQEGAKAPAKQADAKAPAKPANNVAKPAPIRDSNSNLVEREKESRPPRDRRDRAPNPAGDKREKRQFDRKSGTGRSQTENKRGGQGRNNWGGEVDTKEAEALNKEEKVAEKEEVEDAKEDKAEAEGEKKEETKEEVAPAPVEEETFTLDEYLAKRKGKAVKVEALVPRTVTADDFGGLTVLAREEDPNKKKAAGGPKTEDKKEKTESEKKEKKENLAAKLLKFESHQDAKYKERREYNRSYSDDGRRGNNERRNKGPRPPRNDSQSNVNAKPPVQEKDFPALGPHGSDPVKA